MTTFPAATVAPRSVTNLPRNSCSLSLSIAMAKLSPLFVRPLAVLSAVKARFAGALQ